MSRFVGCALALTYIAVAPAARGDAPSNPLRIDLGRTDLVWFPGPSRAVPHYMSASRDTAVLGADWFPYTSVNAGVDAAVLALLGSDWEERIGIFGMIELYGACAWDCEESTAFLWRGLFGGSLALSAKGWAERALGERGKLELTVSIRHESEHSTVGSNYPLPLADGYTMGDFVMPDFATRIPIGEVDLELRAQAKVFVPPLLTAEGGYMTYTVGPGGDLILRWRLHELVNPFVSTFFEYVFGETIALPGPDRTLVPIQVPDLYLVRTQLGGILITAIGDLQLYSFLEVGHGEGVRKFYEEVRWGVGTRGVLIR